MLCFMLSVFSNFTYYYAEWHYAKCRHAECHCAECRYAECHCVECNYAECRGALKSTVN